MWTPYKTQLSAKNMMPKWCNGLFQCSRDLPSHYLLAKNVGATTRLHPNQHNEFPNASNDSRYFSFPKRQLSPAPTTEVDQIAASIGRGHAARGHLDVLRQDAGVQPKTCGFHSKHWHCFMGFSWVNWYDANNVIFRNMGIFPWLIKLIDIVINGRTTSRLEINQSQD